VIAVIALIATWSQTIAYLHSPADFLVNFWRDSRVTASSRNVAADALMLGVSLAVFIVVEARRRGVPFVWLYIIGSFLVALAVAVPLFLIARELKADPTETSRLTAIDTVLLVTVAVGLLGLTIYVDLG
jgi:hypothetical protein